MALLTSSKGNPTTSAVNTAGAKLFVAMLRNEGSPSTPISDTAGNTWVERPRTNTTQGLGGRLYYCIDPTTNASHTFTSGNGTGYPIAVAVFDDASGFTFDVDGGTANAGASHTSLTVGGGGLTPSQADSLMVCGIMAWAAAVDVSAMTIASGGWTVVQYYDNPAANQVDVAIAYKYISSAVATTADWSWTGNAQAAGRIAAFAYSPGGGGGSDPLLNPRIRALSQAAGRASFY